MKKYLIVTGDENDGDYSSEKTEVTEEEIELITPIIQAVKMFKPYKVKLEGKTWIHSRNFPCGEYIRNHLGEKDAEELYGYSEAFEKFFEMVPCNIYSIKKIELITVTNEEQLL